MIRCTHIPVQTVACEYPYSSYVLKSKLDSLLNAGIRTFIDLTEPDELIPYSNGLKQRAETLGLNPVEINSIEYHRFAIPDRCTPASHALVSDICAVLEGCHSRGRKAAIHCRGGVGRTGTIVGCWLVQSGLAKDGKEALAYIEKEWCQVEKSKRFPRSPETGGQEDYVKSFRRMRGSGLSEMPILQPVTSVV
jgi:atypical dual specificity phosphatase